MSDVCKKNYPEDNQRSYLLLYTEKLQFQSYISKFISHVLVLMVFNCSVELILKNEESNYNKSTTNNNGTRPPAIFITVQHRKGFAPGAGFHRNHK